MGNRERKGGAEVDGWEWYQGAGRTRTVNSNLNCIHRSPVDFWQEISSLTNMWYIDNNSTVVAAWVSTHVHT